MDTSNAAMLARLKGEDKVPIADVSPEVWLALINEIFWDSTVEQIPNLFTKIADDEFHVHKDPICGHDHFIKIPQGKTSFDQGIGINTLVLSFTVVESRNEMEVLLMLKPKNGIQLRWAMLHIKYAFSGIRVVEVTVLQAHVRWLDEKEVSDILSKYPRSAPYILFCLSLNTSVLVKSLQKTVDKLNNISAKTDTLLKRIKE
jgi:hypothetical protein